MLELRVKRLAVYSFLMSAFLLVLFVSNPAFGQDKKKPEKEEQIGVTDETKYISKKDPVFAYVIPKKSKFKALKKRWAMIDLTVRKEKALEEIDAQLEKLRARTEKEAQEHVEKLEAYRMRTMANYERYRLLLEVRDHPEQWFRIEVDRADAGKDATAIATEIKGSWLKNQKNAKVILDEAIKVGKRYQKSKFTNHRVEITSEDADGKKLWITLTVWVVYAGKNIPYRVSMLQVMPEKLRKDKKILKESLVLHSLIKLAVP